MDGAGIDAGMSNQRLHLWLAEAVAASGGAWNYAKLARALSEATGTPYDRSQTSKMAKGDRGISLEEAVHIAKIMAIELPNPGINPDTVPLVGYIGTRAQAHLSPAGLASGTAKMPPGGTAKTVAIEVQGDSLGAALSGWIAYFDDERLPVAPALMGQLCVVEIDDGRVFVNRIFPGSQPQHYHLFGSFGDPLLDRRINWAAPVRALLPK